MKLSKHWIVFLLLFSNCTGIYYKFFSDRKTPPKNEDLNRVLFFGALFKEPVPPNKTGTEEPDPWKNPAKLRVLSSADGSVMLHWGNWCQYLPASTKEYESNSAACIPEDSFFTVEFCQDKSGTNCKPVPIDQIETETKNPLLCRPETKEFDVTNPDPCYKTRYSHAVISKNPDHTPLISIDENGVKGANEIKNIRIRAHQKGKEPVVVPIGSNIGYFNNTMVETPTADSKNPETAPAKISRNKQLYIHGLSKIDYFKSQEMISVFLVIGTRTYDQIIQRVRIDFLLTEKKIRFISGESIQMELNSGSSQVMLKGALSWAKIAALIAGLDAGGSKFYTDLEKAIDGVKSGNSLENFSAYDESIFPGNGGSKYPGYTLSVEMPLYSSAHPIVKQGSGTVLGNADTAPKLVKDIFSNPFLVPENTTAGSIVDLEGKIGDRHLFSILSYMTMDEEGMDFLKDKNGMFVCFNENSCSQDIQGVSSTTGSSLGLFYQPMSRINDMQHSAVVGILFSVISSFVVNTVIPQIVNAAVNAVKDWAIREVMKQIPILRDIERITKQISQVLDFVDTVRNLKIPDIKMPDIGDANISFNPSISMPSLEIPNIGINFQNPLDQLNLQPNLNFDFLAKIRLDFQLGFDFGEWFKEEGEQCNTSGIDGSEVTIANRCLAFRWSDAENYADTKECKKYINNQSEYEKCINKVHFPSIGTFRLTCEGDEACDMDFRRSYCKYFHNVWRDFSPILDKIVVNSLTDSNRCDISYPFSLWANRNIIFDKTNNPAKIEGMKDSPFKSVYSKELESLLIYNHFAKNNIRSEFNKSDLKPFLLDNYPYKKVGVGGWFWDIATEGDELCDGDKPKLKEDPITKKLMPSVPNKFNDPVVCYDGTTFSDSACNGNSYKLKYSQFVGQILNSSKTPNSTTFGRMIHLNRDAISYLAKFCYELLKNSSISGLECYINNYNSNYREPIHNFNTSHWPGAQKNSMHIFGAALDFQIRRNGANVAGMNIAGAFSEEFYTIYRNIYQAKKDAAGNSYDNFMLLLEGGIWHLSVPGSYGGDSTECPASEFENQTQVNNCKEFSRCFSNKNNQSLKSCGAIPPQTNNVPLHKKIWNMIGDTTNLYASGGGGSFPTPTTAPLRPQNLPAGSSIEGTQIPFESLPEAAYGAHPLVFHVEDRTNATQEDKIGVWAGDWNEWDSQNRFGSRVVDLNLDTLVTGNYYMVMWGNSSNDVQANSSGADVPTDSSFSASTSGNESVKLYPDNPNCDANFSYTWQSLDKTCCLSGCRNSCVFDQYTVETHTGSYGSVCNVELSNDAGKTWSDLKEGFKLFNGSHRLKFSRLYSLSPYIGYIGFTNVGLGYEKSFPVVLYEKQSPKHRIYTYTLFIKEATSKTDVLKQFLKLGVGNLRLIVKVEKPYSIKTNADLYGVSPVFAQKQEKDHYNLKYTYFVDDKYLYIAAEDEK